MPRKNIREFTTIAIRKDTRERLKHFGIKGRLYDEILNDLMDSYEQLLEETKLSRRNPKKSSRR